MGLCFWEPCPWDPHPVCSNQTLHFCLKRKTEFSRPENTVNPVFILYCCVSLQLILLKIADYYTAKCLFT